MLLCLDQVGGGSDGQFQLQLVPPPCWPSSFVWKPRVCRALMLLCWRLQSPTFHTTICGDQGSKAIEPGWMGGIVLKKTTTVLLIVISLCGHLEKLSMWLHAIHMTGYLFTIANVESCIFGPRVFLHGVAEWISVLKSSLQLEGDSRRSSRDDLIAGRIIIPSLLPSSEAGVSKIWTQGLWEMNHSSSSASVWDQKVTIQAKPQILGGQANMMTPVIPY